MPDDVARSRPGTVGRQRCLVAGSLNADLIGRVDRFAGPDESVETRELAIMPGGHAGNCATTLRRLGVGARLLSRVGNDGLGGLLLDQLDREGIDRTFVHVLDGVQTGVVFVPVTSAGDRALYMAPLRAGPFRAADLRRAAQGCGALIVMDLTSAELTQVALLGRPDLLVFSPGGLIASIEPEAMHAAQRSATHIVVNRPEARALTGEVDAAAARALAARARATAVVTGGADGCWVAALGRETVHVPAFGVDVVDSTGAGDAFVGGFTAALLEGGDEAGAAEFACAVAALSTRKLGAATGAPTRQEAEAFLASQARSRGR